MKKTTITLMAIILFTALLFAVSNILTVSPGSISGNGNPTLLVFFLLVPLVPIYIFIWQRFFNHCNLSGKQLSIVFALGVLHLVGGFLFQRMKFEEYKEVIRQALIEREGYADMDYLNSITSGLTIHVNNQYFNTNTFLMFLTATILLASFAYMINKRLSQNHIE